MSWESEYSEDEVVADHTKVLSKIWDNLIPKTYPHVLSFETKKALEVHKVKRMGPYHMNERFIDYNCYVVVDDEPLIKMGWNKGDNIPKEMVDEAYGELYFHDMRIKMVELSKYAGLELTSSFDFGGELHASTKD